MAEIRIYDGTGYADVEVSDELAAAYAEMERNERLNERKETRRHQSLDKSLEHGFDVADPRENTFEKIELSERIRQLNQAITQLSPEQRELLRQAYFEYVPQTEIARRKGVTKSAVNKRLSRILARLKKFLE